MNSRKLKEIIRKKTINIRKILEQILLSDDPEEIHKLRVEFKKLRAFMRLIYPKNTLKKKDLLRELKELYSTAGTIRDLQVYHQSIETHFAKYRLSNAQYLVIISNRVESANTKLRSMINNFNFDFFYASLNNSLPEELSRKRTQEFTDEQIEDIDKNLKKPSTDKNLHTIRKHLKDIRYNIKHLEANHFFPLQNKKEIDAITSSLGTYNDNNTTLNYLNAVPFENIPAIEKKTLEEIRQECLRQKEIMKIKIIQQLYSFECKISTPE